MDNPALKLWREKKDYLESALSVTTNPAQKFELQHQIEECNLNIQRLSNASTSPEVGQPPHQSLGQTVKPHDDQTQIRDASGLYLSVLVFTDLVDSTPMKAAMEGRDLSERNQAYRRQVLDPHRQRIREYLAQFQGREREEPQGDGFLLEFPNPIQAARFAVAVQISHRDRPIWDGKGNPIQVKIGMHIGYPDAASEVDYAARVISCATGGQILVTESLYGLLKDAQIEGITFYAHGQFNLKGLGERPLFELLYDHKSPQAPKSSSTSDRPSVPNPELAQPPLNRNLRKQFYQRQLEEKQRDLGQVEADLAVVLTQEQQRRLQIRAEQLLQELEALDQKIASIDSANTP